MEDDSTFTSSHRLTQTFDTLLESAEADVTAIPIVRPGTFQKAAVEIYQLQYKNWFMEANQKEWELLPGLWIGTMSSYLQVKKILNPKKTEDLMKLRYPCLAKEKSKR
ncbi:hypothetical protein O181_087997 [Austropuccinia psidii MF-1]|uniref:Uncharacterized protein n=1 Tax=Austropuccinia psidii MF-1 TaxID=1389203 RepID=A0A9Q3IQS2_9BASI|nr:hypothetical protein [Austropuccinia psidii MF-1]